MGDCRIDFLRCDDASVRMCDVLEIYGVPDLISGKIACGENCDARGPEGCDSIVCKDRVLLSNEAHKYL